MSAQEVSGPAQTMVELIAAGDADAAAGFYDGRAASVREYCAELCSPERVDEAALAAFTDLLGRVISTPAGADADELLRRSTRMAAVARMAAAAERPPACATVPELIAARINGELAHGSEPLRKHLRGCRHCRWIMERLERAEDALVRAPRAEPPQYLRASWLELVTREVPERASGRSPELEQHEPEPDASQPERAAPEPPEPAAPEPEPEARTPAPDADAAAQEPSPASPAPIHGRARRGGLVGAAKRLASSTRRR